MKKIFTVFVSVFALLFTCLCSMAEPLSADHLTVTYVTSPLNVPTIVEKENGVFEQVLGIPVSYAEIVSGADQTLALASGDVQLLYAVGGTSVILSAANGADIKVLNMYSRAPGAFCLYSKDENLSSPESLKGKTIAGPAGTNLHELLVAYLDKAGMTIEDVNFISMGIPEAKAGLDGGSVDAALLGGAAAYNAGVQGYHLVTDGTGLIQAIIAVAVTGKFAEDHPDVIEAILAAEQTVMEMIENDKESAFAAVAQILDLPVDAVRDMEKAYDFSLEITDDDIQGFQKTADFMYESDMIEEPFDVNQLF